MAHRIIMSIVCVALLIVAVKTAVDFINGKPAEKRVDTGMQLATKENTAQPEMKEELQPDMKRIDTGEQPITKEDMAQPETKEALHPDPSIVDQPGAFRIVKAQFDPAKRKMLIVPFSDPVFSFFESSEGAGLARALGDYIKRFRITDVVYDTLMGKDVQAACKEALSKSSANDALKVLAGKTNCELILTGQIDDYQVGSVRRADAARATVTFSVQVYDAKTDSVVWQLSSTKAELPGKAGGTSTQEMSRMRRLLFTTAAETIGQCLHDHPEAPQ